MEIEILGAGGAGLSAAIFGLVLERLGSLAKIMVASGHGPRLEKV